MPVPTSQEQQEARALILSKDIVVQRINAILEAGLKLVELVHDETKREEVKAKLIDPGERLLFDRRLATFAMFFNRVMPAKALILHGRINDKRITPEMLEEAGLPIEVLRRLAGIEVTQEEARDVTPENGKS